MIDDACVKSVQEWFIAVARDVLHFCALFDTKDVLQVLDEASTRSSLDAQLQFLEAHKSYMLMNLDIFMLAFQKVRSRPQC
jgi:hypothetical protein